MMLSHEWHVEFDELWLRDGFQAFRQSFVVRILDFPAFFESGGQFALQAIERDAVAFEPFLFYFFAQRSKLFEPVEIRDGGVIQAKFLLKQQQLPRDVHIFDVSGGCFEKLQSFLVAVENLKQMANGLDRRPVPVFVFKAALCHFKRFRESVLQFEDVRMCGADPCVFRREIKGLLDEMFRRREVAQARCGHGARRKEVDCAIRVLGKGLCGAGLEELPGLQWAASMEQVVRVIRGQIAIFPVIAVSAPVQDASDFIRAEVGGQAACQSSGGATPTF